MTDVKMTMALIDTKERLVSKINHKGLGPIVANRVKLSFYKPL